MTDFPPTLGKPSTKSIEMSALHLGGELEGLEQPRWLLRHRLVALACRASADELLHQPPVVGDVEVGAQTL